MERIDHARDGQLRSVTVLSPTSIAIRFSVQDRARGFDWIDVVFQVDGVNDAKLISESLIPSIDMSEGLTVESNGFAIGQYSGRLNEASLYAIGTSVGYEELPYSD